MVFFFYTNLSLPLFFRVFVVDLCGIVDPAFLAIMRFPQARLVFFLNGLESLLIFVLF